MVWAKYSLFQYLDPLGYIGVSSYSGLLLRNSN